VASAPVAPTPAPPPAAQPPAAPVTAVEKPAPAVDIAPSVTRVQATATGFAVTEKIQFADNKANILPASESLLGEVVTVLKDNPDLMQVYIAGYTSSEGAAKHNQELSKQRAASVKTWLVGHGIDAARLSTGGLGPNNPIGDNTTEAGREMNRRVEFTALKYEVNGTIHENPAPTVHAAP
jgi:outer membrane protein OmpA-like peptidoglycan-associated protein